MDTNHINLTDLIRDVPNFPVPGIIFRDITTLLKEGPAFQAVIDQMVNKLKGLEATKVIGIESRGFIFGAPISYKLGAGFVPVRKLGKLPYDTITAEYELEYGSNTVEMHTDAIEPGEKVIVVDDLLATGGTTRATVELVERLGGEVVALAFLIELTDLAARDYLQDYNIVTLIRY